MLLKVKMLVPIALVVIYMMAYGGINTTSASATTMSAPDASARKPCPYEVQYRGSCEALVKIVRVNLKHKGFARVTFSVRDLTEHPLQDVIIDAEAFTSRNFVDKVGQRDLFHQHITVGRSRYSLVVKLDEPGARVFAASIYAAADSHGVFGPGRSNFAVLTPKG